MKIEERVRICRLLEKIRFQEEYSQRIGIADVSVFRGEHISGSQKTENK